MNKYTLRRTPLAATIGSVLATGSLHAATITVDTANDTVVPGECSLRAAIESANTGLAAGGCDSGSAGADEIVFDQALGGGLIIENSLTITGPGSGELAIDGGGLYRHFDVGFSSNAYQELAISISGMTLRNGYAAGDGGAMVVSAKYAHQGDGFDLAIARSNIVANQAYYAGGILAVANNDGGSADALITVTDSNIIHNQAYAVIGGAGILMANGETSITGSTISGNRAGYFAGGLALQAEASTVVLADSVVGFNQAEGYGGGVYAYIEDSGLTIDRTVITGNRAGSYAGGIAARASGGSLVELRNSEVSLNTAYVGGGAIFYATSAQIENTTFSNNHAFQRAAFSAATDTASIRLTTVADNTAVAIAGAYVSASTGCTIDNSLIAGNTAYSYSDLVTYCDTAYSLIGDSAGSYYTDAGGNIVDVDPLIGPLADNGGPTQTRALDPGSPAINAGDPAFAPPPDFDQRGPGFGRLVAGRVDMGAYEFQGEPEDGVFSDRFEVE